MRILKLLTFSLFLSLAFSHMANAQVLLNENFNGTTPLSNWTLFDQDGGTPAAPVNYVTNAWVIREDFDSTGVGDFVATSTSWYNPAGAADDYMVSPAITTGAATVLEWDAKAQDANFPDGYEVRVSTTGPTVAGLLANPPLYTTTAENAAWVRRSVSLSAYANQTVHIAFRNNSNDMFLLLIDNVKAFNPASLDASITSLNSPVTSCNNSATDSVKITISNAGSTALTSVPVGFQLNNGTAVTETFTGNIAPGATAPFTFQTATVNLATPGTYNMKVFTGLANDGNLANDTLSASITSIPVVSTIPYTEDFESGAGGWTTYGANSSWALGTPAGNYITSAAGGQNAWVTNLIGDYNNNEDSYLESPCFDFSSLSADPILSFSHTFETETDWDEGWMELSTDGGITWNKLIASGAAVNWYNDLPNQWWEGTSVSGTGAWATANNVLTGAAGSSSVKVRFVMSSDGTVTFEGFGVDDINIALPASDDVSLQSLSTPAKVNVNSASQIAGTIANVGANAITSVVLNWSVNQGTVNKDTLSLNLTPGSTVNFNHSVTWTPSMAGNGYSLMVWTSEPNFTVDGNLNNDTLTQAVVVSTGNSVQKTALLEQFTTAVCQFCPDGAWVTTQIADNYQDVSVVSVHSCFGTDAMTNTEATDLCSTLGIGAAPTAMVDRKLYPTETDVAFGRGQGYPNWQNSTWATRSLSQSQLGSAADVTINGTYDPATRSLNADVITSFVDYAEPGDIRVSLLLVEDSVIGSGNGYNQVNAYNAQTGHPYAGAGNPIVGYPHRRVLRDILPSTWGDATVIPTNYQLNNNYTRNFTLSVPASFDDDNMDIVAVVSLYGGSDLSKYEVINVEEVEMSTLITSISENESDVESLKIYPNPSANLTNISLNLSESKEMNLTVYDLAGKAVYRKDYGTMVKGKQTINLDVSSFAEGFYFVTLQLGDEQVSRKVSVVR
ncbi:MAG: choice-of-anchor J domain-containing protein [Vicingaceae bacterium]